MINNRMGEKLTRALIYLFLILTTISVLYPVYWIVIGAFNPGDSLMSTKLIPSRLTIDHFKDLFYKTDFIIWYKNTLKIAFFNMILSTFLVIIRRICVFPVPFSRKTTRSNGNACATNVPRIYGNDCNLYFVTTN